MLIYSGIIALQYPYFSQLARLALFNTQIIKCVHLIIIIFQLLSKKKFTPKLPILHIFKNIFLKICFFKLMIKALQLLPWPQCAATSGRWVLNHSQKPFCPKTSYFSHFFMFEVCYPGHSGRQHLVGESVRLLLLHLQLVHLQYHFQN